MLGPGGALLLAVAASAAGYLTPEEAGFADCMLIYNQPERSTEHLMPYVARLDADGTPVEWLFDSFLFLFYGGAPSGASYYNGPTNLGDWLHSLDTWFEAGRDLDALAEAVERAAAVLGPPPKPIQVMFSIHYPSAAQTDFGDPAGEGRNLNLSEPADRERLVSWYIDETTRRFRAANHADLELWGFYWMNEDVGHGDDVIVRAAADQLHDRGLRFLWIPYYRAPGYSRWRDLGFDVAILQPNYAFLEQHGGRIRSDRLIETAALASSLGMGVEIEAGSILADPRARAIFRDYLAFGGGELCGYGDGVKAYYQGGEYFRELRLSDDPDAGRLYDEIADFIHGRGVALPGALRGSARILDPTGRAIAAPELVDGLLATHLHPDRSTRAVSGDLGAIELELPTPRALAELEVSLAIDSMEGWSGILETEVREEATWRAAGWRRVALPPQPSTDTGRSRRTLPVPAASPAAEAIRLRFRGPAADLWVDEVMAVGLAPEATALADHLARGAGYTVSPDAPRAYPDDGRLTDGEVSTEGFSQGRSVGWHGVPAVVCLDLEASHRVDEIIIHCDGGGYASVHYPRAVCAELTVEPPARPHLGMGHGEAPVRPVAAVFATATDVQVDRAVEVAPGVQDSQGRFALADLDEEARYVTLRFEPEAWLMVSEVEVLSGGENVALRKPYRCWPRPNASHEERYADDGVLLTDGTLATTFEPPKVVGWSAGAPEVTLDLASPTAVTEVTVHVLGGGLYGIVAPSAVEVSLSEDGETWSAPTTTECADPGGERAVHIATWVPCAGTARFVRVRLTSRGGWIMVSEIEVR